MENPKKLFHQRYTSLEQKIQDGSDKGLLESAVIVRQLLLDSHPLTDVINKVYKKKLIFKVALSARESDRRLRKKSSGSPPPHF